MSKMLQRVAGAVGTLIVAGMLTFGATQAFASTEMSFLGGTCPPLTPGFLGSCWTHCVNDHPPAVGGDCDPGSPPTNCVCFF